jgi:hypothetical protein
VLTLKLKALIADEHVGVAGAALHDFARIGSIGILDDAKSPWGLAEWAVELGVYDNPQPSLLGFFLFNNFQCIHLLWFLF